MCLVRRRLGYASLANGVARHRVHRGGRDAPIETGDRSRSSARRDIWRRIHSGRLNSRADSSHSNAGTSVVDRGLLTSRAAVFLSVGLHAQLVKDPVVDPHLERAVRREILPVAEDGQDFLGREVRDRALDQIQLCLED